MGSTQRFPLHPLAMNSNFFFLLDGHNGSGFHEDLDPTHTSSIADIAPYSYRPNVSAETPQLEVDFVSTPTSLSLIMPTEPPFGPFIFPPPVHPIPQPFTSEWPLTDSDRIFFHHAAPYHIAGNISHSNLSGWLPSEVPQSPLEEIDTSLNEANEWPCPSEFYNVEDLNDKTQGHYQFWCVNCN